jgi:hypothetical protein
VPVEIAEDVDRFVLVRVKVLDGATELEDPRTDGLQLLETRNREVEVELLWDGTGGPGRARQLVNLLKGEAPLAVRREEVQPVAAGGIVLARRWQLLAFAVGEVREQRPPELGARARVGRIEDDLGRSESRERVHAGQIISAKQLHRCD